MKDFDGKLGKDYSESMIGFPHYFQIQDAFMERILPLIDRNSKNLRILEAGCGSGITTARLAFLTPDCKVLAVDVSRQMITQAQKNIKPLTDRVQFLLGDILQTTVDRGFNIFASGFMLHNLSKKQRTKAICLAHKLLENGGTLALMDKIARDNESAHQNDYQWQIKQLDLFSSHGRPDLKEEWITHYIRDEEIKFTENELIITLKETGFQNIQLHERFCMDLIVTAKK